MAQSTSRPKLAIKFRGHSHWFRYCIPFYYSYHLILTCCVCSGWILLYVRGCLKIWNILVRETHKKWGNQQGVQYFLILLKDFKFSLAWIYWATSLRYMFSIILSTGKNIKIKRLKKKPEFVQFLKCLFLYLHIAIISLIYISVVWLID